MTGGKLGGNTTGVPSKKEGGILGCNPLSGEGTTNKRDRLVRVLVWKLSNKPGGLPTLTNRRRDQLSKFRTRMKILAKKIPIGGATRGGLASLSEGTVLHHAGREGVCPGSRGNR